MLFCPLLPVPLEASRILTGSKRRPRSSFSVAPRLLQTPSDLRAVAWTRADRFSHALTRQHFGGSCLLPLTGCPRAPLSPCLPPPVGGGCQTRGCWDRLLAPLFVRAGAGAPSKGPPFRLRQQSAHVPVFPTHQRGMLPAFLIYCKMLGERWLLLLIHMSLPTSFLCSWKRSCFPSSNICSPDCPGPGVRQPVGLHTPLLQLLSRPLLLRLCPEYLS